ncbi:glycoside hydrolase [Punctularia strigosozonata HHB-11173 SS5]|uniref:glycoside hydrolase n=1 Tax=Punctularia strigosozonata (strain HHB-11173) TaxID=741275 RepID=UPI00044185DA|nr:glycoside hydrolase [Punctularia strigosozonata HHB-11173 SS5]EIN08646.1 glycoside hydrolase [Punctularia strigosozonata HHB-11173 SS5]
MGYNAWNAFQCNINEDLFLTTANLMVSLGLKDAGYHYINLDDCYALKNRTSSGAIVEDPAKFPSGMRSLTDKIHAMGFKAGIYGDSGWYTCAGYPGSFQHEAQDAHTFFDEWNFDLLKFDNCAIPYDDIIRQGIIGKYQRMADAIAKVARPIVFSLCEWGWSQVWLWGAKLGQSWRTTGDIGPDWPSLANIINFNAFITQATNFYGRNDMDMVQLGNGGLTYDEAKSHFTAWALMKSPLLIGTNLSAITNDVLGILKNKEIIAINQDPVVGESISPFSISSDYPPQYWSGDSQNGTVFMLLNTLNETADMSFNLTESPWIRAGRKYSVRDLWTHTENGTAVRNFTAKAVPPHGVVALLLKDAGDEPDGLYPACSVWYQCIDKNGTHVGG